MRESEKKRECHDVVFGVHFAVKKFLRRRFDLTKQGGWEMISMKNLRPCAPGYWVGWCLRWKERLGGLQVEWRNVGHLALTVVPLARRF